MAVRRSVKCPGCGLYFYRDEEENVLMKNRYWHKKCWESHKIKEDQSFKAIEELETYLCDLFQIDFVNARIKKQIKDMIDQYHFSYSGILGTLKYWYNIKGNSIEKANGGIGIVPYVYEDASKYYETIFYAQQMNKDINNDCFHIPERNIVIKSPRVNKRIRLVNLDFLEEGDDVKDNEE